MADINRMIFMTKIKKLMMPRLVITESGGLRGWVGQGVGMVGVAMAVGVFEVIEMVRGSG